MTHLELTVLNYLLNALWQIPVIFLVAALASRLARSAGPRIEHRIWVAALLLEVALPACAFAPALRGIFLSLIHSRTGHITTQTTVLGVTAVHNRSHLAAPIASAALVAYVAVFIFFTARLIVRICRTRSLQHTAQPIALTGDAFAIWQRFARIFGVHGAYLATSATIAGPSTIGVRHRIVLIPATLLTDFPHEDLAAALAHEFAHMCRRDFAKNLLYELVALPIACHPFLWLTRHRIAESREMVCDELAAEATHGSTCYAQSLLRMASSLAGLTPPATLHTVGIFDANILERRVMKLTRNHLHTATSRRAVIVVAIALGFATCASAMSMRLEIPNETFSAEQPPLPPPPPPQESKHAVRVSGGVMAGQLVSKTNPAYPVEAKQQGIEGAVVLHAIIDRDGTVKELAVVSGPPELRQSAIEAVRQWVYKPFLLNGEPTEVDTTITVNYSLAN